MARTLHYSPASLLSHSVAGCLLGSAAFALGWGTSDEELVRHLALFRLAGVENVRWFFEGGGILFMLLGLATFRRLLGGGVAASVRDGGIQFNSLIVSRFVPWRALNGVRLHQWRDWCGTRHDALRVETSSGARDIQLSLLRGAAGDVAEWVRTANDARARGAPASGMRGRLGRT